MTTDELLDRIESIARRYAASESERDDLESEIRCLCVAVIRDAEESACRAVARAFANHEPDPQAEQLDREMVGVQVVR